MTGKKCELVVGLVSKEAMTVIVAVGLVSKEVYTVIFKSSR